MKQLLETRLIFLVILEWHATIAALDDLTPSTSSLLNVSKQYDEVIFKEETTINSSIGKI